MAVVSSLLEFIASIVTMTAFVEVFAMALAFLAASTSVRVRVL